jgi:hypothetical protein
MCMCQARVFEPRQNAGFSMGCAFDRVQPDSVTGRLARWPRDVVRKVAATIFQLESFTEAIS